MCFSVRPGITIPPSLQNIFKELQKDLNLPIPQHGYLQYWAEQGVLLLNNVLTVENGKAHSHQHKGWEMFTDHIIFQLNQLKEHLVFLLWGSAAQEKGRHIDRKKHLVLQSVHPSPLSAYRGFLGNRHFSKTNDYLKMNDMLPIDWSLPDLHHKQGDNKPMNHSFRPSELF
jgi:uracil-DNA glycosylase